MTSLSMGIFGAHSDVDPGEVDAQDSFTSLGGMGQLDIPMHGNWSLQFDVQGEVSLSDGTASEDYGEGFLGGIHVNYRDPEAYLLGAFAAMGTMNTPEGSSGSSRFHMVGVEGQYHLDNWTFYGQAGLGDIDDQDDNDSQSDWISNSWFARGVIRHYFNGGLGKLQGDVTWMDGETGDQDPNADVRAMAWGAEIEHHIADYSNGFVTAFVRYEHYKADEDDDDTDGSVSVIKGGIKISLGYPTPMMRDRYGTGVDFADMPKLQYTNRSAE